MRGGHFTRGSKYSDLTWKLLLFWKSGCHEEMVATRGSTVGILYLYFEKNSCVYQF